jgi:argininosuccinate lyase
MHAFNQSLRYDQRMHAVDIKGSIAYAEALALKGILTAEERDKTVKGLEIVGKEWDDGVVSVCLGEAISCVSYFL